MNTRIQVYKHLSLSVSSVLKSMMCYAMCYAANVHSMMYMKTWCDLGPLFQMVDLLTGMSPLPVTVTTRIITFLVGDPNLNLHLPQASWEGEQPNLLRYGLPLKVIEILVAHFCAFATEDRVLPLVPWPQCGLNKVMGIPKGTPWHPPGCTFPSKPALLRRLYSKGK